MAVWVALDRMLDSLVPAMVSLVFGVYLGFIHRSKS
jgi:hypothetical protein